MSTHSLDYQNHVGEYGVHWNFFLTLAVVRIAGVMLGRYMRSAAAAGDAPGALSVMLHCVCTRSAVHAYPSCKCAGSLARPAKPWILIALDALCDQSTLQGYAQRCMSCLQLAWVL